MPPPLPHCQVSEAELVSSFASLLLSLRDEDYLRSFVTERDGIQVRAPPGATRLQTLSRALFRCSFVVMFALARSRELRGPRNMNQEPYKA